MNEELTIHSQVNHWFQDPVKTTFTTTDDGGLIVTVETQAERVSFSLSATQMEEVGEFMLSNVR